MFINLLSHIFILFCERPVKTKTSLKSLKSGLKLRPQKTAEDWSIAVQSGLLTILDNGGPVSVSVLPKTGKRPDRTELPNTIQHCV